MKRLRLWLRLAGLVRELIRRPSRYRLVVSEVEAIHRALGHDHQAELILPQHQNLT